MGAPSFPARNYIKRLGTIANGIWGSRNIQGTLLELPIKPGGLNLFDKATTIIGSYIVWSSGAVQANATYFASDFIKVEGNTAYTVQRNSGSAIVCFYDTNKTYISGISSATNPVITPVKAKYMRISIAANQLDSTQVVKSSTALTYEAYRASIDYLQATPNSITMLRLPPKIYALVGKEVNIYFDNLMADDAAKYDWEVTVTPASKGVQQDKRWTFTPVAEDIGTHTITITAYRDKEFVVGAATATITVKDVTVGSGISKTALFIGDSTLNAGVYTSELLTLFSADSAGMSLSLIGTQGIAPNKREGYSGRTIAWMYTDAESPFVKSGVFNFPQYMTDNSFASVDYVCIGLGINDSFTDVTDSGLLTVAATAMTQLEAIITSIKEFNADVRIGILTTIPPSKNQDAFGKSYGVGQTRWRYKRNHALWNGILINQFAGRETSNIYLVPVDVNLDTENNMSTETVEVNSRNSATAVRQSNGVHPADEGYYQMSDVLYYWLKSLES